MRECTGSIPTNTASEEESTAPPSNNPHGHDEPSRSTIITALLKPGGGEVVERTFDRQGRLIGVVLTDGTILRTISHNSKDNSLPTSPDTGSEKAEKSKEDQASGYWLCFWYHSKKRV